MRYAAFLRGVSPTNASNPELKRAFEKAGFAEVSTFLSSGNVRFTAPAGSMTALEKRAEAAMAKLLGHSFLTIIRSMEQLEALLATDPYRKLGVAAEAKRVVTFLREPPAPGPRLPIEADGCRIVAVVGREAFTAYLPTPKGPVFMTMIQKAFGKEQTTRTWQTVARLVK